MIKVSVIVPIFNAEKYLKRCLESLVNQTLKEIEIILINDASEDNSINIINEYEEKYPKKIQVINLEENVRQGGARNKGLDIAKGEYIGFIDSDDWAELEMFEILYNKAKENDADIVDSQYLLCKDVDYYYARTKAIPEHLRGKLDVDKRKELLLETATLASKIYRREFLNENNLRFIPGLMYEENDFVPTAILYADYLDVVEKGLYCFFRENPESITIKMNDNSHFDRLTTAKKMIDNLKEKGFYETYKEEIDYIFIKTYYINTIGIALTKFNPVPVEKLEEIKEYMKENYPEYRKNKYFKKLTSGRQKRRTFLNDINPKLLIFMYKGWFKTFRKNFYEEAY